MLTFNEGKVCEAIVQRLEQRLKAARMDMRWPEDERHPFPVELAFTIGGQLFALEHTGIEPFKAHVQMDAEADRLFTPIVDALKNALGTDAVFELMIPANALPGRKMPEVRGIQQALIDWVKATAPTVPSQRYGDYKKTSRRYGHHHGRALSRNAVPVCASSGPRPSFQLSIWSRTAHSCAGTASAHQSPRQ